MDLLLGVDGAGFGDDAAEGNSIREEIVAAYSSLGVAGVFVAAAAEGDDQGGDVLAVELDGVIETGVKDGGWVAGVLGCAEDGDGVGGLGVVFAGNSGYLLIDPEAPCHRGKENKPEQPAEEETAGGAWALQIGGRGDHRVGRTMWYGERMRAHIDESKSATGTFMRRASLQGGAGTLAGKVASHGLRQI